MTHKLVRVLKAEDIELTGSVCLGTGSGPAPVRTDSPAQMDTAAAPQQARIVESNTEYAVIEVICSCGTKNYIQCNYGQMAKQTQE